MKAPASHPDRLAAAVRFPGLAVLLSTPEALYLSGRGSVWRLGLEGGGAATLAPLPLPRGLREAARIRLVQRLGRLDLRELWQTDSGDLLGMARKTVVKLDSGSREFRPVFRVPRGGRPRGAAVVPGGRIFMGEYWGNPQRRPLRIWASADDGVSWELVHTLPAGRAKHIHNLVWDPHRRGLWVLTGDADGESALLFTRDEFATVTEVARGGQQFRACQLFCRPEGLYYATDTELDQNWAVFFEPESGKLEKLQPLPGSCIYAARMAGRYWISTSVEPSKINRGRHTILWWSADLCRWTELAAFTKDCWPGEYLGFGRIVLPRVQGDCPVLAFSPMAVRRHDYATFLIKAGDLPSRSGQELNL